MAPGPSAYARDAHAVTLRLSAGGVKGVVGLGRWAAPRVGSGGHETPPEATDQPWLPVGNAVSPKRLLIYSTQILRVPTATPRCAVQRKGFLRLHHITWTPVSDFPNRFGKFPLGGGAPSPVKGAERPLRLPAGARKHPSMGKRCPGFQWRSVGRCGNPGRGSPANGCLRRAY